jgi:hypothetical protein
MATTPGPVWAVLLRSQRNCQRITEALLQVMLVLLISLSMVRERERGTFEQLALTPVKPLGLMAGAMIPYGMPGFLKLCVTLIATVVTSYRVISCSSPTCHVPSGPQSFHPRDIFIGILRGMILRGAVLSELWTSAAI